MQIRVITKCSYIKQPCHMKTLRLRKHSPSYIVSVNLSFQLSITSQFLFSLCPNIAEIEKEIKFIHALLLLLQSFFSQFFLQFDIPFRSHLIDPLVTLQFFLTYHVLLLQPVITETVSEDISYTHIITRVKATDADEYDSIHFELNGPGAEQFRIDRTTGKNMCKVYSVIFDLITGG